MPALEKKLAETPVTTGAEIKINGNGTASSSPLWKSPRCTQLLEELPSFRRTADGNYEPVTYSEKDLPTNLRVGAL